MAMTYRPPDDLAELLRLEAYRRHTSQTTIINAAVSLYLAGSHLSDDLPKPPKKWKAPDEDKPVKAPSKSKLVPMVRAAEDAGLYEKTDGPPPPMRKGEDWEVTRKCPGCGLGYVVIRDGSGSCRNKCGWTGKVKG